MGIRGRAVLLVVTVVVVFMILLVALGALLSWLLSPPPPEPDVPSVYLYVNDLASPGVLLYDEEDALDGLCWEIDYDTTAEVAILTVNTTQPLGIDMYAVETFERNGIGKAGKDNGVLIVVSVDERQWRIEVGYGLEPVLNPAKVGRFGDLYLGPNVTAGDYFVGLFGVTDVIGEEIRQNYDPGGGTGPPPELWYLDWKLIGIGIAIFVFLGVITRGRIVWFIPIVFRRAGFGGGRSGGTGAKRRF